MADSKADTSLDNKGNTSTSSTQQDRSKTPNRNSAHEEKLRIARERQNEERQKKIEELKAQAEAAQKYREQKEEERRRRIEELRSKDMDKRQQVEERKRAIEEAEKERREYILRRNMERDSRIEVRKRNERSSLGFAFGSSTPRLLDPADFGTVSPSSYWGHRRSTSISNVSYGGGATLSRRSSERELSDGAKKRAISAGGADRNDDNRRKSTSMYEIFNWGSNNNGSCTNDQRPKRLQLSIIGNEINIDDPPPQPPRQPQQHHQQSHTTPTTNFHYNYKKPEIDLVDSSHFCRSVYRRKTDLMPTIPSPRDHSHYFGSKSSICNTPRTPGRAVSMTRLDQLAQPIRRCGIHIRAIEEREKRQQLEQQMIDEQHNLSKSLTHLGGSFSSGVGGFGTPPSSSRPLRRHGSTTKSSRSGDVTPGGSRPGSAMSTSTNLSLTSSVVRRSAPITRKPRPVSIAGTGMSPLDDKQKKPPTPSKAMTTPKRQITSSSSSRVSSAERKTPVKKDPITPRTPSRTPSLSKSRSSDLLKPKDLMSVSCVGKIESHRTKEEKNALNSKTTTKTITKTTITTTKPATVEERSVENTPTTPVVEQQLVSVGNLVDVTPTQNLETSSQNSDSGSSVEEKADKGSEKKKKNSRENSEVREIPDAMSASMMAKKITTEEEAKAALAERRRLAREEAERQAELERQRLEAERQAELKRQQEEEEKQRKFEEESNKMAEQARLAEEMRLQQAIEEAKKREEAEKQKQADEERLKNEKEVAERKAKEDAEKLRLETAERLKQEEKEREERRKRVEAIMKRTRNSNTSTPSSTPSKPADQPKPTESETQPESDVTKSNGSSENNHTSQQSQPQSSEENSEVSAKLAYEQSVKEKENSLLNSFSSMLIDENNTKNLQQNNGHETMIILNNHTNGNGHFENIKKDTSSMLVDLPSTNDLIDVSSGDSNTPSQQQIFNNNNSLLVTTTGDSHENKDLSLL
ncbi:ens family protein [Megaselia abdita]